MQKPTPSRKLSRRDFLKIGGGLLACTATTFFLPRSLGRPGGPAVDASLQQVFNPIPDIHLAVCDGWIHLPGKLQTAQSLGSLSEAFFPRYQPVPKFDPDNPETGLTASFIGFRNVTGMPEGLVSGQKMKAQASAPLIWANQDEDYLLSLSNLGLQIQPDQVGSQTIFWQGFQNTFPVSDAEPLPSLAVPVGQTITMVYRPHNPGTHIYRCDFGETERAHRSTTGTIFIRPIQNGDTSLYLSGLFAYNDEDGSTGYDREFAFTLTSIGAEPYRSDSHPQPQSGSSARSGGLLLNGRVYPDTLAGNGGESLGEVWGHESTTGDLVPPPDRPDLRSQPISSLIEAEAGERILIRCANLSSRRQVMSITGLKMKVVGRNATLLRGRDGTDFTYDTDTISIGIGESLDVIITAPSVRNTTRFMLFNRLKFASCSQDGGQMTEIRIHPPGTLAPQGNPNTNPHL